MKNKKYVIIVIVGFLAIIGSTFGPFFYSTHRSSSSKEITIDTLYVDYSNLVNLHIRNFRDTEECVKKVFECYENIDNKAVCFISDLKATHIEHKRMYVDDTETNRLSLSRCYSIPFSLDGFYINLKKKTDPILFDITREADTAYFKGDFDEMNFAILKSFDEAIIFARYDKKGCQAHVLVNRKGEHKFEFSADIPGRGTCRTYKIY